MSYSPVLVSSFMRNQLSPRNWPTFSRGIQFFTTNSWVCSWGFWKKASWGISLGRKRVHFLLTRSREIQFSWGPRELADEVLKKASWCPPEKVGQFPREWWLLMSKVTKTRNSQWKLSMSFLPTPKPVIHFWWNYREHLSVSREFSRGTYWRAN